MVYQGGASEPGAGVREIPGATLLEGWQRRAQAAFQQLEEVVSPTDAHRLRIELIDAVGALLGIESMVARHLQVRTHLDPLGHAAHRARVRHALLCIASSAPWERRHQHALSTIRAALWEQAPGEFLRLSRAYLREGSAGDFAAELSRVVASFWPLGDAPASTSCTPRSA